LPEKARTAAEQVREAGGQKYVRWIWENKFALAALEHFTPEMLGRYLCANPCRETGTGVFCPP
jgi:hypothetical protein